MLPPFRFWFISVYRSHRVGPLDTVMIELPDKTSNSAEGRPHLHGHHPGYHTIVLDKIVIERADDMQDDEAQKHIN